MELYIAGCNITDIDFSSCTKLLKLSAGESSLVAVEAQDALFEFALKELYISNSAVKHVAFAKMPWLENLAIDGTKLREVNLISNTALIQVQANIM